jgi:hypothetical protein
MASLSVLVLFFTSYDAIVRLLWTHWQVLRVWICITNVHCMNSIQCSHWRNQALPTPLSFPIPTLGDLMQPQPLIILFYHCHRWSSVSPRLAAEDGIPPSHRNGIENRRKKVKVNHAACGTNVIILYLCLNKLCLCFWYNLTLEANCLAVPK